MKRSITQLRRVGYLEGVSFLVLLAVAMPLKYFAGFPQAVKFTGWIHGILFVAYCLAILRAMREGRWPLSRGAILFVAALIPGGPFLVDRKVQEWDSSDYRGSKG